MTFMCKNYGFETTDSYGKTLRLAVLLYDALNSPSEELSSGDYEVIWDQYIAAFDNCLSQEPEYDGDVVQSEDEAWEALDACNVESNVVEFKVKFAQYLSSKFNLNADKSSKADNSPDVDERTEFGNASMKWSNGFGSFFMQRNHAVETGLIPARSLSFKLKSLGKKM